MHRGEIQATGRYLIRQSRLRPGRTGARIKPCHRLTQGHPPRATHAELSAAHHNTLRDSVCALAY